MAEIAVRWIEDDTLRVGSLADVERARASKFAWVDVTNHDENSLQALAGIFNLHPLAIEDCLHFPQRPKLESYEPGLFIIWLAPFEPDGDEVPTHEVDVFLGSDHLITIHSERIEEIDDVALHAQRLMSQGADFLLHDIVDRLVDRVLEVTDSIEYELENIEDTLLENPTPADLQRLHRVRRRLVKLHKIIGPERDIIRALARERELVDEEAYRYLQDVGDHLARVQDSIETNREVASAAMDIYLSAASNRMNEIMKVLTAVATIFMPLTLISGIYGMNLLVGMWPPVDQWWSFWLVVAVMLLIAVWMIWFFRRRRWW